MHHKFAVIDSLVLVTGSFNWTTMAAYYNDENVIIVEDKRLIEKYNQEFENLWKQFEANQKKYIVKQIAIIREGIRV